MVLTGSGTCAVEAMISSLAPREAATLVISNGVYGERIAEMLRIRDRPLVEVRSEWTKPMDLRAVEAAFQSDTNISHVAAVHNETTTGRLNQIRDLADLCLRYEKSLMLDSVSSFGAEAIDFEHPSLLAVAATANKCLHGIVGVAFVMMRQTYLASFPSRADSIYLDLYTYQEAQRSGFSPFTQATHAFFALEEALAELRDQGGWLARRKRYRQLSLRLREALIRLGAVPLLEEAACSSMISSFALPAGWNFSALHDRLKQAGFVIYAGQGDLFQSTFRISTMGDIGDDDMERLINVLASVPTETGW